MTSDPLGHIYKKMGDHLRAGDEKAAREHLANELQNMPEEMRDEVLFQLFIDGLQQEVAGREAIAQIQAEGADAIDNLLEIREVLEEEEPGEATQ